MKKAYIAQCVFAALLVALGIALSIEVFGEMNLAFIRVLSVLFSAALLGNIACVRPGSLDTAITQAVPNDIPGLLHENPSIGHIFFNGRASQQVFLRHHKVVAQRIPTTLLPSTSPAAAAFTFAQKLDAWRAILAALEPQERS